MCIQNSHTIVYVNHNNFRRILLGKSIQKIDNYRSLVEKLNIFSSSKLIFGNNVKIGAFSSISSTSHMSKYGKGFKIGNNSGVGRFTEFGSSGGIDIGNDVIMGRSGDDLAFGGKGFATIILLLKTWKKQPCFKRKKRRNMAFMYVFVGM